MKQLWNKNDDKTLWVQNLVNSFAFHVVIRRSLMSEGSLGRLRSPCTFLFVFSDLQTVKQIIQFQL